MPSELDQRDGQAHRFALSIHEVAPLVKEGGFTGQYEAFVTIAGALREKGVSANIVAGGLNFYLTKENIQAAQEVLGRYGLDVSRLGSTTFAQDVNAAGGLEKLAAMDPKGRAAQIMAHIRQQQG